MLKTVKKWKWDSGRHPPPLFFQNSHIFPFFFGGNVPNNFMILDRLLLSEFDSLIFVIFLIISEVTRKADCSNKGLVVGTKERKGGEGRAAERGGGQEGWRHGGHNCHEEHMAEVAESLHG